MVQSQQSTVCVDLDGTLAQWDGPFAIDRIGKPFPGAAEFMLGLKEYGRVVIYSCRTSMELTPECNLGLAVRTMMDWLVLHGIPYDSIYVGHGKPVADAYIDDHAVPCSGNPDEQEYKLMLAAAAAKCIGCDQGLVKVNG